ncbi:MAG: HAD-IIB family hydrolase [Gomphosphaeria aponina SAG 52.96 = DSM 107014]|uniref:HAD-IIB family hydrolase n=1 Tax=Gomphosphaeria aponina SAG 52.96 = DSM 107014 TaxID=1521640 RepID=A0A941GXC5_9CHRO|nr:HAD-IIB family hydrolase [Gomphosphaeria aponina SAG 52.96 = DSM 107014]
MRVLIFTDLDGTLLNQEDYQYAQALPLLEQLKIKQIPVIPVTSKTRLEVEHLRNLLGLSDPFVVENGSGIFYFSSGSQNAEILGVSYAIARRGLEKLGETLGEILRGFGDLTDLEIAQLTGLSLDEVKLATAREFSEPFITPRNLSRGKITETVEKLGFRVVVGDRFSHLIGGNAGKGKAVQWLINYYQSATPTEKIVTIGLGNSPNDKQMLATVDYPIIIPGKGGPHPGLTGRGWKVAPAAGSLGWAKAVAELIIL